MEKLNKIPHKFLFYFGLFIVLIFLSLSYWQFTSFQNDKITLNEFKNNNYTYPANYPLVKLDYAFISKNKEINNYHLEILESQLSDHKPICFYL